MGIRENGFIIVEKNKILQFDLKDFDFSAAFILDKRQKSCLFVNICMYVLYEGAGVCHIASCVFTLPTNISQA